MNGWDLCATSSRRGDNEMSLQQRNVVPQHRLVVIWWGGES
jgi:hypothetical protein